MAARTFKIRKIIFGIRFKFSLIIILAVIFSSVLIVFALINQHEKKIRDSLERQGSTVLNGISDQAKILLINRHTLASGQGAPLTPAARTLTARQQADAMKNISLYFSSVVGKEATKEKKEERLLDIAFMVDIRVKGTDAEWKKDDHSIYIYFNRTTGEPFTQKNGRNDPLLEPTIVSHYMNTVDTGTYIGFASAADVQEQFRYLFENKPDYVIVGIPILRDNTSLYNDYNEFRRQSLSQASLEKYLQKKKDLPMTFTRNIILQGVNLDYRVTLGSDREKQILLNYLMVKSGGRIEMVRSRQLKIEFNSMIDKASEHGEISILHVQNGWKYLSKKYGLPYQPKKGETNLWQECYFHLVRSKVPLSPALPLEELARISYRNDLAGILGLFLYRTQFFPEMIKSQNEIINLMVSILIRAIFLALLFPTFIIRSITRLADGAVEIGKGNLDRKIEIPGSDEIGRLADIFNVMTGNLKKAEAMKIEKVRMEKELLTAQQIQAALLPKKFPDIRGVEFGAYYSAQTESGGDYYDFIDIGGGRLGVTIADVSGHGVGSGLVMAMTRTLLHTYCATIASTKKIFEIINDYLKTNTASNYFVTMFYGILTLESLRMTYSSAGHCLPILIRDGRIRQLPAGGMALGVASGDLFSKLTDIKEIQLQRGDYLIQYTDGVDEAMDANRNEFGLERFHKILLTHAGKSPQEMVLEAVKEIDSFTGAIPQHDDITMIIIKIK
jgi:serine phosphatase RsbU (regulator of sigma subunit)